MDTVRKLGFSRIVLPALTLAIAAACGGDGAGTASTVPPQTSFAVPANSIVDWVTYADQVSVVTVVNERVIEPSPEVARRGEGYVGREVTIRVDETLWSSRGGGSRGGEIILLDIGWVLKNGKRIPFAGQLEVGRQYLLPLGTIRGQMAILHPDPIPVLEGRVIADVAASERWSAELAEKSVSEIRQRLEVTQPDPAADAFRHLDAVERANAVSRAKGQNGVNP
jgi:hypothetical protein